MIEKLFLVLVVNLVLFEKRLAQLKVPPEAAPPK
jgi:hypothetical protein